MSPSDYLQEGLTIVVVGASGDLAKKKTYPSLLDLFAHDLLPPNTVVWGYARSHLTSITLRQQLKPYLLLKQSNMETILDSFLSLCHYKQGESYGDDHAWKSLSQSIQRQERDKSQIRNNCSIRQRHNRLFYMAIPPNVFIETALAIRKTALQQQHISMGWSRLVIEKPFGHDLESCRTLLTTLGSHFPEHAIYRIDHYLGKEMVQNMIIWRFGNSIFEPMWNRRYVRSVRISFREPFGTDGRGGYFDNYGIIRDVIQNHLLQILVLVAMEAPVQVDSGNDSGDHIRDAKHKVLLSIPEIELNDCLLGQYEGYSNDTTIINKETNTPTYAAIRCSVRTPRWDGVPFVLEAGKALQEHLCEVCIELKGAPSHLFPNRTLPNNNLVIRLQPNPSISMMTNIKTPGLSSEPTLAAMKLQYNNTKNTVRNPDAYTRLLLDVLRGEQANFVRADELERSWEIFTPLLHRIEQQHKQIRPKMYKYGSTGPKERELFFLQSGISLSSSTIMRSVL